MYCRSSTEIFSSTYRDKIKTSNFLKTHMRQKKPLWLDLRNTLRCTTADALVMTLHELVCGRKWGTSCFLRKIHCHGRICNSWWYLRVDAIYKCNLHLEIKKLLDEDSVHLNIKVINKFLITWKFPLPCLLKQPTT